MGSSERQHPKHHAEGEEVDLDADTKESTEELFLGEETAESPHKIILWYKPDTPKVIGDRFPKDSINRQIGREVTLGRNKTADVLLYEKHMARNFATVGCRINTARKISFVLRNACDATKQKRILVTDSKGHTTDLLPTQEVELVEQTTFKLECVEFVVGIELGDLNSRSFELVVKPSVEYGSDEGRIPDNRPADQVAGSIPAALKPGSSLESAFIGLPLTNSIGSSMNPSEQVVPKYVVQPHMSQGYGNGAVVQGTAVPMMSVMPQQIQTGFHAVPQPPVMNSYLPQNGYGYCEIHQPRTFVNQPSAMHHQHQLHHQYHDPNSLYGAQSQLLERGAGYSPLLPTQPCSCHHEHTNEHSKTQQRMSMNELAQALSEAHGASHQPVLSPRGIVTTPSTQDQSPVFYPSPANPRFRFPQPQAPPMTSPQTVAAGTNPGLSDLPRGPPLARLSSGQDIGQSIDLHPQIPARVVPTQAVSQTERSRCVNTTKSRMPEEHEDKPK